MNSKIISLLSLQLNQYRNDISKKWKIRALNKAIISIKNCNFEIKNGKMAINLDGVGKGIAQRIDEICKTGTLDSLINEPKLKEYSDTLITKITGVGNIRAKKWLDIGLHTIEDVINAKKQGKITTTHHIDIGLKYYDDFNKSIPRNEINKISRIFSKIVKEIDDNLIFEICGSYRRGKDTSGDIDILITNPNIKDDILKYKYLSRLITYSHKCNFIIDDLTKFGEKKYMGVCHLRNKFPARRIDIRCFNYSEYYAAIIYFTGSKNFNIMLRNKAINRGYLLNEYGLIKKDSNEIIKLKSEQDVFSILNLYYINPTERNI